MADTTTTNYAFVKPEIGGSANTWGQKLNDDLDAIDAAIKAAQDDADQALADLADYLPLAGGVLSGDVQFSGASFSVRANTADAADTKKLVLAGGGSGATTRGAYIELHGNEHATDPGELNLFAGVGFDITMLASNVRMTSPAVYINGGAGTADLYLQGTGVTEGGIFSNVNSTTVWHDATAINLRPGGRSVTTGQFTVAASGNVTASGSISDASGNVRRLPSRLVTTNGNLAASDMNAVIEKNATGAVSITLGTGGLGQRGDAVSFVNSSTSGDLTIARGGAVLYQNGGDADITVTPGSIVTIYRSETSNRWIAP